MDWFIITFLFKLKPINQNDVASVQADAEAGASAADRLSWRHPQLLLPRPAPHPLELGATRARQTHH